MPVYRMLVARPVDPTELERALRPPWGAEDAGQGAYWVTLESEALPSAEQTAEGKRLLTQVAMKPDPVFEPQRGGMVSPPRPMTDEERARLTPSTVVVPKRRARRS